MNHPNHPTDLHACLLVPEDDLLLAQEEQHLCFQKESLRDEAQRKQRRDRLEVAAGQSDAAGLLRRLKVEEDPDARQLHARVTPKSHRGQLRSQLIRDVTNAVVTTLVDHLLRKKFFCCF